MGTAKLYSQKPKGIDINGLIKDYYVYAGENVNAGDFVEFVNGVASTTTTTATKSYSQTQIGDKKERLSRIEASRLSSTRVLIVGQGSYDSTYTCIACVLTITGGVISAGTQYTIKSSSTSASGFRVHMVLLTSTTAIITYASSYDSTYSYVKTLTISGTTISIAGTAQISTTNNIHLAKYSSSMAYCAYLNSGKITVVPISADNTKYTSLSITLSDVSQIIAFDYNTTDEVLLCASTESTATCYLLSGGSSITSTKKASASVNTDQYSWDGKLIDTDTIIFAYGTGGSSSTTGYLRARVLQLNNTNLTVGTILTIDSYTNTGGITSPTIGEIYLKSTLFVIAYKKSVANYYSMICSVSRDGVTLSTGATKQMGTYGAVSHGLVSLTSDGILVWEGVTDYWGYNYCTYYRVSETSISNYSYTVTTTNQVAETQVRPVTTSKITGVAKTSGIGGTSTAHNEQVSIVTPYSGFNLVVDGNFSNGLEGWVHSDEANTNITYTVENNWLVATCNTSYSDNTSFDVLYQSTYWQTNHIYYMSYKGKVLNYVTNTDSSTTLGIHFCSGNIQHNLNLNLLNEEQLISSTYTWTSTANSRTVTTALRKVEADTKVAFTDIKVYDLTDMFGSGNEPDLQWCDENL